MEKNDIDTAQKLVRLLREKNIKISTAESITGGMLASMIVDVPGASDVFEEGYVTYSDRVKNKNLGVGWDVLEKYSAVSEETAARMAAGCAAAARTEAAVSTTGYAGPFDAKDKTPAGTVYIGIFYGGKTYVEKFKFDGERNEVRRRAAKKALDLVLERLD